MSQKSASRVVLVGRPNVGKSTLFNRLSGARRSIVTSIAGTTRDVITHPVTWGNARFDLTDTGGLFGASADPLHELVVERGKRALKDADLVVFVVDGRDGLISGDQEIAAAARETGVPVVLAINKMDDRRGRDGALELYQMGFDSVVEISAEHGQAVGDLLEVIVAKLPQTTSRAEPIEADEEASAQFPVDPAGGETSIAIVGRPNAGKSSLVNRLLREERMIVSEVPGTTRDSVDSVLTWHRRQLRIVDTAGIRKPGKVSKSGQVETLSVMLAKRAIERADVVVLVIDAVVGPTDQDGAIAGVAKEAGRGIIVAANKWDLMKEQGPEAAKVFDENLRYQLKFLDFAPILHISAATGERTPKLLETVERVYAATRLRVPTGELNRFIQKVTTASPPVTVGRRNMRVMYAAQAAVAPPTFVLFTNSVTTLHFSYERFLENRLREAYGFAGTPIRIQIRGRAEARGGDTRKTARERAPERRSPVKKGPGSVRSKHERDRAASQAARNPSSWDKASSAKAPADKAGTGRGKRNRKSQSSAAKRGTATHKPNLSKKSRAKQGGKGSGR